MSNKPSFLIGALVGLAVTAPLIAISGLGFALAGLPYAPFDLFPVIRDLTPGPLLTFTIDTMVDTIIQLNLGRVDQAAKTAEQAMAVGMLIGVGVVVGLVFFFVMNRVNVRMATVPGLILGLLLGVGMSFISASVGLSASTGQPFLNGVWLIVTFGVWGLAMGWIYSKLVMTESTESLPAEARSVA